MTRRVGLTLIEAAVPVGLLAVWWLVSAGSTSPYLPPLSSIIGQFRQDWLFSLDGTVLLPSVERIAAGLGAGVILGIGLGVILGSSEQTRRAFEPILEFFRGIPTPAIIPITLSFFGLGNTQKAFLIAFGVIWPTLLNTVEGIRGVDPGFRDMSRVYGLRRMRTLWSVTFRAATPQIFVGVRISVALSLLLVVVAEMFASHNGLGYFIITAQNSYEIQQMWSGILLLAILSYAVNLALVIVERRVLYWHRGWRNSALGITTGRRGLVVLPALQWLATRLRGSVNVEGAR